MAVYLVLFFYSQIFYYTPGKGNVIWKYAYL